MTKEQLEAKLAELQAQLHQAENQVIFVRGAIALCEQLITDAQAEQHAEDKGQNP